jgi:DeoR family transcriptional regulator of aga operon
MVDASQRCVVVAEGSKIGDISVVKIADLDSVDVVVTGSSAPEEALAELANRGPTVEVASLRRNEA